MTVEHQSAESVTYPIVTTKRGALRGTRQGNVSRFMGIPFAQPAVDELRWRAPRPPLAWDGVRDASTPGNAAVSVPAPAPRRFAFFGGHWDLPASEDCLYLNAWTPALDGARRPVLVWLHGGGFANGTGGSPACDGAQLAATQDCVVVTINYRLGALGWLALHEFDLNQGESAANFGLLDALAALQWVHDEIAAFGGDPDRVLVFGSSAGAIMISALLGAPQARGLFQRAVIHSGAENHTMRASTAARTTRAFLEQIGVSDPTSLRTLPLEQIIEGTRFIQDHGRMKGMRWGPNVDGDVIPIHPTEAVKQGLAKDVTVMIGTDLDEFRLMAASIPGSETVDLPQLEKRLLFLTPGQAKDGRSLGTAAIEAYIASRGARGDGTAPPELYMAIASDHMFRYPSIRLAEALAAHNPRTYMFLYTHPSPMQSPRLGACHGLEIPLIFGSYDKMPEITGSGPETDAFAGRLQESWVQFAWTGDPSTPSLGVWPPYDATARATMLLAPDHRIAEDPLSEERRFWGINFH